MLRLLYRQRGDRLRFSARFDPQAYHMGTGRYVRCNASSSQLQQQHDALTWTVAGIESTCDDTGVGIVHLDNKHTVGGQPDDNTRDSAQYPSGATVLCDVIASQFHLHAGYAGIVPHFAARAHAVHLPTVWQAAMDRAAKAQASHSLDAIALAVGPGLAPCLSTGLDFVKRLASPDTSGSDSVGILPKSVKYIIPVNHLEAHLLVPRMVYGLEALSFPFLVLLVSGGHTMLVLTRLDERGGIMYERLATTLDDSLGECFDKVARIVRVWKHTGAPTKNSAENSQDISADNLASISSLAKSKSTSAPAIEFRKFGGTASGAVNEESDEEEPPFSGHLGAMLEQLAAEGDPTAIRFPVPLRGSNSIHNISCCFSFSGLKSAVHRYVSRPDVDVTGRQTVANIAAAFHLAALSHLGDQVARAFSYCGLQTQLGRLPPVNKLVICGGVAANTYVRESMSALASNFGAETLVPPIRLCTDNGVMIAWAGMEKLLMAQAAHTREIQSTNSTSGHGTSFDEFARTQGILSLGSPHFKEDLAKLDIAPRWRFT